MNAEAAHSRGGPLAMLVVVAIGWVGMRTATWESPFPEDPSAVDAAKPIRSNAALSSPLSGLSVGAISNALDALIEGRADRPTYVVRVPLRPTPASQSSSRIELRPDAAAGDPRVPVFAPASYSIEPGETEPQVVTGLGRNAPEPSQDPNKRRRWSADAWVLWRQGSGIAQGRRPSYGASQAGAILNYRLKPSSGHDPRVFVRGYRALIDNPETEVSLGVSARPVPKIPLRVHAEVRATDRFDQQEIRPSAFVTTELPPQKLPFDTQAEFYGQAGYVDGDFPTHFADGQVHVMREVKSFDLAKVSLGAAAWGGLQKGADRLDVGPTLRVDLDVLSVPARVSVDYRYQIAGDAEPGSGVAVTLSTHF